MAISVQVFQCYLQLDLQLVSGQGGGGGKGATATIDASSLVSSHGGRGGQGGSQASSAIYTEHGHTELANHCLWKPTQPFIPTSTVSQVPHHSTPTC